MESVISKKLSHWWGILGITLRTKPNVEVEILKDISGNTKEYTNDGVSPVSFSEEVFHRSFLFGYTENWLRAQFLKSASLGKNLDSDT